MVPKQLPIELNNGGCGGLEQLIEKVRRVTGTSKERRLKMRSHVDVSTMLPLSGIQSKHELHDIREDTEHPSPPPKGRASFSSYASQKDLNNGMAEKEEHS